MRQFFFLLFALYSSFAYATTSYEGTWFSCEFSMAGQRNPWSLLEIRSKDGQLNISNESGGKYSFWGKGQVRGEDIVIRGCSYYVGQPVDGCNPKAPAEIWKLKLQSFNKKRPSNLDLALKRGDFIYVDGTYASDTGRLIRPISKLTSRCEELIELKEKK